eukprot:g6611.t1
MPSSDRGPPSRRRKNTTTASTATTLKPPQAAPRPPAPRRRQRGRQDRLSHTDLTSDDENRTHRTSHFGQHPSVTVMNGVGRARGILDFALGGSGGGGGGGGQSMATSHGGDEGSVRSTAAADEEGLGLLRQQLSAVQRIRVEHERKDAAIAALRLEVSNLSREREEMLALNRERNGEWVRLVGVEERCRRLEERERDTARLWAREENAWKEQLAEAQEQYLAERDRTEFRLGSMTERLNTELEEERAKSRDLEEQLRTLEEDLAAAKDRSERLTPRVQALEEANETLRGELTKAKERCSEAEVELSQLQVYRPLLEQADSIDRRRAEAEEGLRAAAAEVSRERDSSTAAKQEAAQLRSSLAKAEAELRTRASKALSLERDLVSATARLEVAEAGASGSRFAASALDELAELVFEAISSPPLSAPAAEGAGVSGGRAGGGGSGGGGGKEATLALLAGLEARLARVSDGDGGGGGGGDGNREEGLEARAEGGRDGVEGARWCFDGRGGLRRAVRAVRTLAEAAARAAVDRDRAASEVVNTQEELRSALGRLETSQQEVARLGQAVEEASAARSALLPKLRDTQVSREAAEVVASRASSELAEVRGFLGDMAAILAHSTEAGPGSRPGSGSASADGDKSPWSNVNSNFSRSGSPAAGVTGARLVSAVSAGIKGLLAERAAAGDALRDLEKRCSQSEREMQEVSAAKRDGDAAHREQLVELRGWCESEVEAQRRAKKAAQAAADCALRDLSTAAKRASALEKEKARTCKRLSAANVSLSSLAEEAAAAKHGLRLLARACVPLVERCRTLAAQKRLLTKWHGPRPGAPGALATAGEGGGTMVLQAARGAGGAAHATAAELLLGGLRSLADALGRETGARQRGRPPGGGVGSNGEGEEGDAHPRSAGRNGGQDRKKARDGGSLRRHQKRGQQQEDGAKEEQEEEHRPLVSLRVVGIAAVAAQRLARLAAYRAARRACARAAATRRVSRAAAAPACETLPAKATGTMSGQCTPPPPPPPTSDRGGDGTDDGGFITLGPRGLAGRGVALLDEDELVPLTSVSSALSSLFSAADSIGISTAPGGRDSGPKGTAGAPDAAAAAAAAVVGCNGGGRLRDDGESAAARCLELLDALVGSSAFEGGGRPAGTKDSRRRGGREGTLRLFLGNVADPSLLQVVAGGQALHRSRLEKRGLVPRPPWAAGGDTTCDPFAGGRAGASRVIASRCARHHGRDAWRAWRARAEDEEALSLLEATRRGTAALARLAGEGEARLLESEAGRQRAEDEIAALAASKRALSAALERKSELVSFLEEKVHIMEGEAAGTVPAAALAGTEKALTESLAEVETLRVRSASLYAELAEASARRKRETRQARKGAQAASKEKAARAQLQEELLSLRSYVLRSEQTVQELQEEARRQARETSGKRYASSSRSGHEPVLAVADDADRLT